MTHSSIAHLCEQTLQWIQQEQFFPIAKQKQSPPLQEQTSLASQKQPQVKVSEPPKPLPQTPAQKLPSQKIEEKSSTAKPQNTKNPPSIFTKEELTLPPCISFSSYSAILQKIAPHLELLEQPPSDSKAQKLAKAYETKQLAFPLTILVSKESKEQLVFLQNIAFALERFFAPCHLVRVSPQIIWEEFLKDSTLRLILVCDQTLWEEQTLRKHFKEFPGTTQKLLHQTPVFLFPDLTMYLENPSLKASLWKALWQKCQALLASV